MKITKRDLKKIIKEFKNTTPDFDIDSLLSGGSGGNMLPPVEPPRGGGGGGGDGDGTPWDPSNNNPKPCGFGDEKGDMYYSRVFDTFGIWLDNNYPDYDDYLQHLFSLGIEMDELSEEYMEFFELLMTAIGEYACAFNIQDLESIYRNPSNAIRYFN